MSSTQKTLVGSLGVLLLAFVVFGVFTWIRVIQVTPYSSSCPTTLIEISSGVRWCVHFSSERLSSALRHLSLPVVVVCRRACALRISSRWGLERPCWLRRGSFVWFTLDYVG